MVTFNFNLQELKNNTTADKEANSSGGKKFFNEAGTFDVTLSVSKCEEKPEPNQHWHGLQLDCTHADGRSIKYFIDFPTTSDLTNMVRGEPKHYAYGALKRFLVGCGVAETVADINTESIMDEILNFLEFSNG